MTTRDSNYVICPFCGGDHGDAWEWCGSEDPQKHECQHCGKTFVCWAEYSVDYCARAPLSDKEFAALGGVIG